MQPVLCTARIPLSPGDITDEDKGTSGAEHMVYILEGEVEARIGKGSYRLKKGGSVTFDGKEAFSFRNTGKEEAQVLSVRGIKEASTFS